MSHPPLPHERLTDLRRRASSRLTGAANAGTVPFAASDALAVLHDLADSDALVHRHARGLLGL